MVNCARSFLRPLTSQQEALEWQSPPARALITTSSWRRSARTGWANYGSLATSGLMVWTANLGGEIRHTEIRADFKAPAETETEGRQKTEKEEDHE